MNLTWEVIGGMIAIAGVVNYVMLLSIKSLINENSKDMQKWINGSFMRTKEVEAKLAIIQLQVTDCRAQHERNQQ